jgi:hypothetical protein
MNRRSPPDSRKPTTGLALPASSFGQGDTGSDVAAKQMERHAPYGRFTVKMTWAKQNDLG